MKKTIELVKKNFYFAIIVVVLLFLATYVVSIAPTGAPTHGTLYTDRIEPKTGTGVAIAGANVSVGAAASDKLLYVKGQSSGHTAQFVDTNDVGVALGGIGGYSSIQSVPSPNTNLILQNFWGNVGIGTANPVTALNVYKDVPGAANGGLPVEDGTQPNAVLRLGMDNVRMDFGTMQNGNEWIQTGWIAGGSGQFPLLLNPLGGNIGIGTSAPTEKLDVNGNIKASGDINASGTVCDGNGCIGSGSFGTWETKDVGTVYPAQSAGFVIGIITKNANENIAYHIEGYTGTNNPPTILGGTAAVTGWFDEDWPTKTNSFTMPVSNGNYYRVVSVDDDSTASSSVPQITIYWVPLT